MITNHTPIEYCKSKLYQNENSSKVFLELSEEQLLSLAKAVYKMQERTADNLLPGLVKYKKTLQYLTSPLVHINLKTFDEKMAYLIMMTDPNLVMFKEFLKIDLISVKEINKIENETKRNQLKEMRTETIEKYKNTVREKIGFFDAKILKYEEMFFKRFFNEKELIIEVIYNNQNNLMDKAKSLRDFNEISKKRYDELTEIAQTWLALVQQNYNYSVATYSITNQSKLLGLNSLAEQLTLFILLTDNNLDMLRIYEEESTMKIIEERIIEQFGYYNKELIILEKKFHSRFCPSKKLSIW